MMGRRNSCMEIGHVCVVPCNGLQCGCGNHGCLETVASRLAIAAQSATAVHKGQAPCLEKRCGTDVSLIKSGDIALPYVRVMLVLKKLLCRQLTGWG